MPTPRPFHLVASRPTIIASLTSLRRQQPYLRHRVPLLLEQCHYNTARQPVNNSVPRAELPHPF